MVDVSAVSISRNNSVAGPLSLTEENGDNTLLLTSDACSTAETNTLLAGKMDITWDLVSFESERLWQSTGAQRWPQRVFVSELDGSTTYVNRLNWDYIMHFNSFCT